VKSWTSHGVATTCAATAENGAAFIYGVAAVPSEAEVEMVNASPERDAVGSAHA